MRTEEPALSLSKGPMDASCAQIPQAEYIDPSARKRRGPQDDNEWGVAQPLVLISVRHHPCYGCPILAFFARVGGDAADTVPVISNPVTQWFVVPTLRQERKQMGHLPPCCLQRDQTLGPPASGIVELLVT